MRENKFMLAHENEPHLSEALRDYHAGLEIPDGEQAWELMSRRMLEEKPVSLWRQRMKLAIIAAGLTLIIHLFFWAVNPVQAITRYYFDVYRSTEITDVSFGNYDMNETDESKMLTAPPPEEDRHGKIVGGGSFTLAPGEPPPQPEKTVPVDPVQTDTPVRLEYTTLEEAADRISFPVQLPGYLPDGYALTKVTVFLLRGEEKSGAAYLEFFNEKSRDMMILNQHPAIGKFGMSSTFSDPKVEVKEVEVNGAKGVLVLMNGNFADLQWFDGTMYNQLKGRFSEREILKIAESVKKSSK